MTFEVKGYFLKYLENIHQKSFLTLHTCIFWTLQDIIIKIGKNDIHKIINS